MSKSGIKILINGEAGAGKTELLRSLGEDTFVVSRDNKEFALPIPHMLVDKYYDMETLLYGGKVTNENNEEIEVEGVLEKLDKYFEKFGKYPRNIVIDSVSQLTMDVIESASEIDTAWGKQGAFITKEMAILTKFIHEELELNGINVILLNHVIPEKAEGKLTGSFVQFGQGKFKDKGGFYSTTNESITIEAVGSNRVVHLRGTDKQARTMQTDLPSKMYVENFVQPEKSKKLKEGEEYFVLANHIKRLENSQTNIKELWSL